MPAHARLTEMVIDVDSLARAVAGQENGAVVTFVGQTRNNARGRKVAYLEYEAYAAMAEKILRRIAEEAEARWGVRVAMEHRLGRVDIGEASVVICVGSPHRAEAFEACRHCIDTLKETAPIWKKEVCPDGTFWIEGDEAVRAAETGMG